MQRLSAGPPHPLRRGDQLGPPLPPGRGGKISCRISLGSRISCLSRGVFHSRRASLCVSQSWLVGSDTATPATENAEVAGELATTWRLVCGDAAKSRGALRWTGPSERNAWWDLCTPAWGEPSAQKSGCAQSGRPYSLEDPCVRSACGNLSGKGC